MRTTLDLDTDILHAVKELASAQGTTMGRVISDLLRQALEPTRTLRVRNGVPVLPRRPIGTPKTTMELVNELRDEL